MSAEQTFDTEVNLAYIEPVTLLKVFHSWGQSTSSTTANKHGTTNQVTKVQRHRTVVQRRCEFVLQDRLATAGQTLTIFHLEKPTRMFRLQSRLRLIT